MTSVLHTQPQSTEETREQETQLDINWLSGVKHFASKTYIVCTQHIVFGNTHTHTHEITTLRMIVSYVSGHLNMSSEEEESWATCNVIHGISEGKRTLESIQNPF